MRAWSAAACACAALLAVPSSLQAAGPIQSIAAPLRAYDWFPGRWACRTSADASAAEPRPAKLWVTVAPGGRAIDERFQTTLANGTLYRSDDVLRYDAALRAFERRSIDMTGTQILLAAKGPFAKTMRYVGIVGLQTAKVYRMQATVTVDDARDQFTTATAFWHPDKNAWVVQSTTTCAKISG